jgi:hypothetical protein
MNVMSLNATFSFDPWERYRVMRALARGSRSTRIFHGLALFLLLLLLFTWLYNHSLSASSLWYFGIFVMLIFVGLPLMQLRMAFKSRTVHGPPHTFHGLELNDTGIRSYCDHTSSEFHWAAIHKARETAEFFLVYYARECAFYLPKRALDAEQIPKVRELLESHLGERAVLQA